MHLTIAATPIRDECAEGMVRGGGSVSLSARWGSADDSLKKSVDRKVSEKKKKKYWQHKIKSNNLSKITRGPDSQIYCNYSFPLCATARASARNTRWPRDLHFVIYFPFAASDQYHRPILSPWGLSPIFAIDPYQVQKRHAKTTAGIPWPLFQKASSLLQAERGAEDFIRGPCSSAPSN